MSVIPFAEWLPDMPDLAEGTTIATGVIAKTPQSYGPQRALARFTTNALNTTCLGMGSAEDTALIHHIFAGSITSLFHTETGSTAWSNVTGTTAYAVPVGESWRLAQFKNLMFATDYGDLLQVYDMIAGGVFAAVVAAPNARYLAVAKNFLILASTNDPVGGANPARLWWSAFNAPQTFPTPGSATAQQDQSDYNDMLGPMGAITGLAPNLAGCDCAIFFERGVFRMVYTGPPNVFSLYPAANVRGTTAPNSIVALGDLVYYRGEDGWYVFDGNQSTPIGANKIDRWFQDNVDPAAYNLIIGAPDVVNKAIVWIFRSINATGQVPDTQLTYRWDIQRWTMSPISAEWIARIQVSTNFNTSPSFVAPLTVGQSDLAAVDGGGYLAYFSGPLLDAEIGTQVVQLTPGARSFVSGMRPLVDSGTTESDPIITQSGLTIVAQSSLVLVTENDLADITVAMSVRATYQQAETFGPAVPLDVSGQCSFRSEGRYHRGRVTIPGGKFWSQALGLDPTYVRSGSR